MRVARAARIMGLSLLVLMLLSGCYYKQQVESSEVGLILPDGVKVEEVVGPGRYTSFGWYAELRTIDVSAYQIEWSDPDLVTRDLQPMGIRLQVTFARDRDANQIRLMWDRYRQQATDDEALQAMVLGRIPAVAKEITARYTLTDLIGTSGNDQAGRSLVAKELSDLLAPQLTEVGVQLLDIGVTNIDPGEAYVNLLREKANVALQRDIAEQRTIQLQEQLRQEQAQTEITLEIARRERDAARTRNEAFTSGPQALELEKARLIAEALRNCTSFCAMPNMDSVQPVVTVPAPTPTPN